MMAKLLLLMILVGALSAEHSPAQNRLQKFGDIVWQVQVPNNPGPTIQDRQVRSLKQIPDVNGDNVNDVIAATGNYWTLCYSGLNGTLLWQYSTHFGMINTGTVEWEDAVEIADVNNDGIHDVVIGCAGGNEMVYALNGLNGHVLWSYGDSTTTSDGDIESICIKYDYNGDGINDALVSASGVTNGGRHAAICLNALNGQVIFYREQPQSFTDDIVATDIGGAIGVNNNGAPYGVNGFDTLGNNRWSYTTTGNTWSLKEIPDINSDGINDITGLSGFTGYVFAISGSGGAQIWTQTLGSSNNGRIQLLDDADGNGFIDITLSAPQSASRIDTRTGAILWSIPLSSSYIRGVADIGDVSGDGIHDIAIATQVPARLIVLSGMNGEIFFDYLFGTTLSQRGDRSAVLNDIDSNGVNEFLGGNREGRIICFYGGNGTITNVSNLSSHASDFMLHQNFPNPFNPSTEIKFSIREKGAVRLTVYDMLGRETKLLIDETLDAGTYSAIFDAAELSGGVYFYELLTENYSEVRKMLLLK